MKFHLVIPIILILFISGCSSTTPLMEDNGGKISPPIIVALYSSENDKDFVVAPGDEFEITLIGNCVTCFGAEPGEIQFVFERIDQGIEIENFMENDTIDLEIPYVETGLLPYNKIKIKVNEKGYHVIRGKSTLLNTAHYFEINGHMPPSVNFEGEFSVDICVVDTIDEIKELCGPDLDQEKYVSYFATNSNAVEYIGSIQRGDFPQDHIIRI
jgi:hypothetical protein